MFSFRHLYRQARQILEEELREAFENRHCLGTRCKIVRTRLEFNFSDFAGLVVAGGGNL